MNDIPNRDLLFSEALSAGFTDEIVSMHDVLNINQNTFERLQNVEEIIDTKVKELIFQKQYVASLLEENKAQIGKTDEYIVLEKSKQAYENSVYSAYLVRLLANSFYSLSSDISRSVCFNATALRELHFKQSVICADNLQCFLEPDGIYISLPMLCSRNYYPGSKKYYERPGTRSMMFSDSIPSIIMDLPNYNEYDFSRFREKTFNFLFCYNRSSLSVADTDNHEIKAVTDAVAMFLPREDAGEFTDFNLHTRINPALNQRTYLTVLPGLNSRIDEEKLFSYWLEKQTSPAETS